MSQTIGKVYLIKAGIAIIIKGNKKKLRKIKQNIGKKNSMCKNCGDGEMRVYDPYFKVWNGKR